MLDHVTERPRASETRRGTVNLRIEDETRRLIDEAAKLVGKTRTDFMIDSARQHAIDVLLDQRLFVLDAEQHDAFIYALDNPPKADPKLEKLLRKPPAWEK